MADFVKTSSIKLNPANPRTIRDDKFRKLVQSIREFPKMLEIRPIVVNAQNEVLGGNMRLRACIEAGLTEVPIIRAETLTDDEQRRFIITDNAGFGEWDWGALANEWDAGELADWGLDVPGFDVGGGAGEAQEDEYEMPDEIHTDIVAGDLFEIGPHRLLCGDSTKAEDVERLMGGEKADICVTDPPYGVNMDKGFEGFEGFGGFGKPIKRRQYADSWDSSIPDKSAFDAILNSSKVVIIFGGNFFAHILPQSKHWIFWDKKQTMPTFGDGELCWTNVDRKSVVKIEVPYNGLIGKEKDRFHPTQKPVKIISEILESYSDDRALCMDLFLGSGTTMVAAHQLGRRCYGMEIDPKYCQVIVDRMLKLDPGIEIKRNGQPYDRSAQNNVETT